MSKPVNLPPHASPSKPQSSSRIKLRVNGHCHVNGDGKEYPWAPERGYDPVPASYEQLEEHNQAMGFNGGCVIVAATCHGNDNSFLINALEKSNGRAMGVASVPLDATDNEIERLYKPGVRGFRFSYVKRLVPNPPPMEKVIEFGEQLKRLALPEAEGGRNLKSLHIDLYVESNDLVELKSKIEQIPVPVVFDHMAIPDVKSGPEEGRRKFELLKDMLRNRPDFVVKLSGPERVTGSSNPADWGPALLRARELMKEFPDQAITGSDWPHPNLKVMVDDGKLVDWMDAVVDTEEEEQKLHFDNVNRLFPGNNFEPAANLKREPIVLPDYTL